VPLYTSEECLRATVPDGTPFVALDVAGLLDAVEPEAWLGVNPGTESGVVLPANAVRGAVGPQQAAAGTEYAIGEPATEPAELLDDLRHWFAAEQPGVARAWRAQLALSGRAPEPLIGLELEPGTELDPVFAAVVDRVERHGRGPVTLVPVDPTAPEGPAAWLLERTRPFYVRGA
jgi:hypothetical protein